MELIMGRTKGSTNGISLLDRLLSKVIVNSNDCWEWQGGKNNIGYGMMRDGPKMRTTHRVSYEEHNQSSIPSHLVVMHSCDNKLCVNPAHLSLGTRKDNTDDMIRKGRHNYFGGKPQYWNKGKARKKLACVHCGVMMADTLVDRYHNDNCKNKLSSINTISADSQA
jgi:hypothetical protein